MIRDRLTIAQARDTARRFAGSIIRDQPGTIWTPATIASYLPPGWEFQADLLDSDFVPVNITHIARMVYRYARPIRPI